MIIIYGDGEAQWMCFPPPLGGIRNKLLRFLSTLLGGGYAYDTDHTKIYNSDTKLINSHTQDAVLALSVWRVQQHEALRGCSGEASGGVKT